MGAKIRCTRVYGLTIFLVLMSCLSDVVNSAPVDNDKLTVRIVHTNDMHSRFEETSRLSGICSEQDAKMGKCFGGFARIATLIREARNSSREDLPTFFLNAGDTYQGTKLFSHYKWKIVAKFLNILKPDAASLGNHEFDDGVKGLVPFLNNITFPVVTANLDLSDEPTMQSAKQLKKSTILIARNKKIGVVGYLTPETRYLSMVDGVKFIDEVSAIKEESKKLKSEGCDIIIALGHSGYEVDMKIAREVPDVDLVIGGHTNTFLWNGEPPDTEKPEGLYPTEVLQASGRKVYVVQAYAYTKYLGDITVDFDGRGEITRIVGKPILVDSSIPMAEDVKEELKKWTEPLANMSTNVIGNTRVLLEGREQYCRLNECNFGNFVTDAMIHYNTKTKEVDNGWADSAIAIHQSGGIRSSITTINENKVTMDDVITAFPFGTKVFKVDVPAKTLWEALEWSVHDRITQNTTSHGGCFLQYSGLQVTYDLSKPVNSRVVSAKARCNMCNVPEYHDLNMEANYKILVPDFLYNGGDGFSMLKNLPYTNLNVTVADAVANYLTQMSPVYPGIEGRIKFVIDNEIDVGKVLPSISVITHVHSGAHYTYQLPTILVLLSTFLCMRSL